MPSGIIDWSLVTGLGEGVTVDFTSLRTSVSISVGRGS